jgi:hypothetical protein
MFSCPLGCWRRVAVREQKTKIDWALEVADLLEKDYPITEKIRLVCNNLNVHSLGALYETFDPVRARALARRLAPFQYFSIPTPKHGSLLRCYFSLRENELSALTVQ